MGRARHSGVWAAAGLVLAAATCLARFDPPVPKFADEPYAVVGGTPLLMDFYVPQPEGGGPYPVVLWIHGGAWRSGDKWPLNNHLHAARRAGFAVASIDYRLTSQAGKYGDEPVTWPAQINDVKGAVRYLRANADAFNIDPDRIAVWGVSAGGQLAALLGTSEDDATLEGEVGGNLGFSSGVQAVVDYCGVTDIMTWAEDIEYPPGTEVQPDSFKSASSGLVGWDQPGQGIGDIKDHLDDPTPPYPGLVASCLSVSPMAAIEPGDNLPPYFIAHGDQDTTVPHKQSERLEAALDEAGAECTYRLIPGAGHNALGSDTDDQATAFLVRKLVVCPADLNLDGQLDLFDLLAFVGDFNAGDPQADCNRDGVLDLFDLLCFTNLLNAGC